MKKNILLQAPVFSISGYGAHARDIALALLSDERFNVSIKLTGWGGSSSGEFLSKETMRRLTFGINNKLRDESDSIFIHVGIPTEFQPAGKYNVGITAGLEVTRITSAWVEGCNKMDLVVVPTKFISDIFINCGVTSSMLVVPEGVDTQIFSSDPVIPLYPILNSNNITTEFNFLSIGQWLNYPFGKDRKQIALLIDTFMKAFEGDNTVGLILKTYTNNISTPDEYFTKKKIEEVVRGRKDPQIYLLHGELTEVELGQLYHTNVHAYVSMTSGEGWNRPTAEAACSGMPIVITGWSGHMDYLQKESSSIIAYALGEIPAEVIQSTNFFEQGMQWAYPNIEDAIAKMRDMRDNYATWKAAAMDFSKVMMTRYEKEKIYKEFSDVLATAKFETFYAEKEDSIILNNEV